MEPGLEASVDIEVTAGQTAPAFGSGDVEVLGTPGVAALCERAAFTAVAGALSAEQTTVGTNIVLDHLAPTLPGRRVTATARLVQADGKRLEFTIEAADGAGPVARGTHTRVVVDRERFLRGAADRG